MLLKTKNRILIQKALCFLVLVVFFFNGSACLDSQQVIEDTKKSTTKREKTGNLKMPYHVLNELLASIDSSLFASHETLKDAVYMELPMSNEEGIAVRLLTPIDITTQQDASLVVLIGISAETNSRTPLADNGRIILTNKMSKKISEVSLFEQAHHKIPMPEDQMPAPPQKPMKPAHSYIVEVINIRERLKFSWTPSEYSIQIISGEMASNIIDFKLIENRSN